MPRIPTFTEVKRQNEKAVTKVPLPPIGYVPSFNDANRVIRGVSPLLANAPINPNDAVREARTGNLVPLVDKTNSTTLNATLRGNPVITVPRVNPTAANPNDLIRVTRTGNLAPVVDQFTVSNMVGHQATISVPTLTPTPTLDYIVTIGGDDIVTIQGSELLTTIL